MLLGVARGADEPLREYVLEQLTQLVRTVRQHIRRFLPELLGLIQVGGGWAGGWGWQGRR